MISVFLHPDRANLSYMLSSNGTVIKNPLSAYVIYERNGIWYLQLEFPISEVHGKEIPNEAVFKVDLGFIDKQLFRLLYVIKNKKKKTYTCYCNHVFFDAQKEVVVFDKRSIKTNWTGAVNTLNTIISESSPKNPYHVYGRLNGQTTTAYWEKYNLLECMFGDDDNTLVNRWMTDMQNYHPIAMYDNFNCYFGDMSNYPQALKPKNIYFSAQSELTDNQETISTETTITGIIPQAYNGYMLPNHEIVKSSKWDSYKIHRIEFRSYDDIKLKEDASDDEQDIAYDNLTQVYAALRERANEELAKESNPTTTYGIKPIELPNYKPKVIKPNDTIYLVDELTGKSSQSFQLNSYKWNLITNYAEDIEVIVR